MDDGGENLPDDSGNEDPSGENNSDSDDKLNDQETIGDDPDADTSFD